MAVTTQEITDRWAVYCGDCIETMQTLPSESVHLSVYSPPFGGLYQYSSSERDLSNCLDYEQFFTHYEFVVRELARLTHPGRMTAVHCMDVPSGNSGCDHLTDFPGDIIRLHERNGWRFTARYFVWKEPLGVRNRTLAKGLAHKSIVDDSSRCTNASADQLLVFRRKGENRIPIRHPHGLTEYAGERKIPTELLPYKGWTGKQTENRYSHWIWRQYASAFWDDVRIDRVLPFRDSRDPDDEKHVHPLQLDVIERTLVLWSNPGEVVLTPFMGVGSEVFAAVQAGRKAIGVELKPSYFRQALANLRTIAAPPPARQVSLFDVLPTPAPAVAPPVEPQHDQTVRIPRYAYDQLEPEDLTAPAPGMALEWVCEGEWMVTQVHSALELDAVREMGLGGGFPVHVGEEPPPAPARRPSLSPSAHPEKGDLVWDLISSPDSEGGRAATVLEVTTKGLVLEWPSGERTDLAFTRCARFDGDLGPFWKVVDLPEPAPRAKATRKRPQRLQSVPGADALAEGVCTLVGLEDDGWHLLATRGDREDAATWRERCQREVDAGTRVRVYSRAKKCVFDSMDGGKCP